MHPILEARHLMRGANRPPASAEPLGSGADRMVAQNLRLVSENANLAAQISNLTAELDRLKSHVRGTDPSYAASLDALKYENSQLAAQNADLAAQNNNLTAELHRLSSQQTPVTESAGQAVLAELKSQNAQLAAQNGNLTAELNRLTSQVRTTEPAGQEALAELKSQNAQLVAKNATLTAELNRLSGQIRSLESAYTGSLAKLKSENTKLAVQNSRLTASLDRLTSRIRTTEPADTASLAKMKSENTKLFVQNTDLAAQNSYLTATVDRLSDQIRTTEPAFKALVQLSASLTRMKSVWLGHQAAPVAIGAADKEGPGAGKGDGEHKGHDEKACELVLRDNMWVLAPDLAPVKINQDSDLTLRNIFQEQFKNAQLVDPPPELNLSLDWKPSICGWFESNTDLQRGSGPPLTYVIMDLKASREQVTRQWMDECYAYALTLIFSVPGFWSEKVRCFVVGETIADGVREFSTNYGPNHEGIIQITPLTYTHLFMRAKRFSAALLKMT